MQENNTQAAIDAGKEVATATQKIQMLDDLPVIIKPDGTPTLMTTALELLDKRAHRPRRLLGRAKFTEIGSFVEHVNRFKADESAIFFSGTELTCVYNYHVGSYADEDAMAPGWSDHRASYLAPLSRQWSLWTSCEGKAMTQEQFGEFVDQALPDLVAPQSDEDKSAGFASPAGLSSTTRNLVINARHQAERRINQQTGEISLVFKIENEESSTKLPSGFLLGIPVFEAGTVYRVEAKLYLTRGQDGPGFKLSYRLLQSDRVLKHAMDELRKTVHEQTQLPVWAGSPEQ